MLPKPTIETLNGWLSPEGLLYPCAARDHYQLAQVIVAEKIGLTTAAIDPQRLLEKMGWAKLASDRDLPMSIWMAHRRGSGDITWNPEELPNGQYTTIVEWHHHHERTTPLFERIEHGLQEKRLALACA